MSFHRFCRPVVLLLVAGLVGGLVAASTGCGADRTAKRPSTSVAHSASTTVDARVGGEASTTSAATGTSTTTAVASTTTIAAPPSTKPLTTAPPSQLLTEVTAAYDAAYADLLAATLAGDENYPSLGDHMEAGELESWREVLRRLGSNGHVAKPNELTPWRRVESLTQSGDGDVSVVVCRFDNLDELNSDGVVLSRATRAYRYLETFRSNEGGWKWAGREWIDSQASSSDCAWPS